MKLRAGVRVRARYWVWATWVTGGCLTIQVCDLPMIERDLATLARVDGRISQDANRQLRMAVTVAMQIVALPLLVLCLMRCFEGVAATCQTSSRDGSSVFSHSEPNTIPA